MSKAKKRSPKKKRTGKKTVSPKAKRSREKGNPNSVEEPLVKPELLAPAGSQNTFFAAIEAGADAIYLGGIDFNARMRADNFTRRDLETAIPYAHSRKVKIYITLNTLIKQDEIPHLLEYLLWLEQIKPDGLIVQDYGVAMLAARYAPSLPLHGSTQMAIHNSAGSTFVKRLGFQRVILARECTLDEIRLIGEKSGIETEVFAHGALCYSISGQCYFSSYLGGASANRGRCTQPCRRLFKAGKNEGAFFSTKDLCLIDRLYELARAKVACIKIEGRLKSEAYIGTVVSAYRQALDSLPGLPLPKVSAMAQHDFGRSKSFGFIDRNPVTPIINPNQTAAGQYLGKVKSQVNQKLIFSTSTKLEKGDRLRIVPKFEGDKASFVLKTFEKRTPKALANTGETQYEIPYQGQVKTGDLVFLLGHKTEGISKKTLALIEKEFRKNVKLSGEEKEAINRAQKDIFLELKSTSATVRRLSKQYTRVALPDQTKDLRRFMDKGVDEYIVPLNHNEIHLLPRTLKNLVVLRVPLFIREKELAGIKRHIREAISKGFTRFLVGNPAHFQLLYPYEQARIQVDYTFGVSNSATLLTLANLGAELVSVSIESDSDNLSALLSASSKYPMELVVYGRPPLFTSAAKTPLPLTRDPFEVKHIDENLMVERRGGVTVVTPKTPFALMGRLKSHEVKKMAFLRIELSAEELEKSKYNLIQNSVSKWAPLKGTRPFNYKQSGKLK